MKRSLLLCTLLSFLLVGNMFAQPTVFNANDPVNNYNNTPLPPSGAIYKWVRTPRPEVNFNSDRFKCYYYNGMAFRLRYPNGYNPADVTKKYPVILFFHGGGEASPNTDNEFHLLHGAAFFENRINAGLFNAFLLFPASEVIGWEDYMPRINNVLDSLQKYCNLDPDRLITMGLSIGGNAAISYGIQFPQRTATVISSSPALIDGLSQDVSRYIHIPHWLGSGGRDINPSPTSTQRFVDNFTGNGGDMRYSYYPDLGHNVWDRMWGEPYLFPYWNAAHKANPLVYFKQTQFPTGSPINARIGVTAGYAQYQWQKDLIDISGATSNEIVATQPGSYRVRFQRASNPNWSEWSPTPAVITGSGTGDNVAPTTPLNLRILSSTSNSINLDWDNSTDNVGVTAYDIYLNGAIRNTSTASDFVVSSLSPNTSYTFAVRARDQAGNASALSSTVTGTTANVSSGLTYKYYEGSWSALPNFSTLTPVKTGSTPNIDLSVRTPGRDDNFAFLWEGYINITTPGNYVFETISDDGSKFYFNSQYSSAATALVNNDGLHAARSATGSVNIPTAGTYPVAISFFEAGGGETMQVFWTGPNFTRQPVPNSAFTNIPPPADNTAPSAPANLRVVSSTSSTVTLDWDNSTDNVGVTGYDIYRNGVRAYSSTTSDIVAGNLAANTSYTFTVKALDQAGNASAFSNSVTGTTSNTSTTSGLNYKYYEGTWSALPDFNQLTPVKTGATANVDLSVRTPGRDDNFALLWEGSINITTPGDYVLETISDDGSKFYFNTQYSAGASALVNNDGMHAPRSATGSVNIPAAGTYPIAISFFEAGGGETMQVYWSGPGISRQLIPNSAFVSGSTPPPPPPVTNGLNFRYYEGAWSVLPDFSALTPVKTGSTANVDLSMRNRDDNFGVLWDGFIQIPTAGTYTFETVSDDGSKFYFNTTYSAGANALVNNDGLHAPRSVTGTVNIPTSGAYPVAITFFEAGGGETMQVYWTGPGIPRQQIPNSAFTKTSSGATSLASSAYREQGKELELERVEVSGAYPNPFEESFTIGFTNSSSNNKIRISMYDAGGRLMYNRNYSNIATGNTSLRIDVSNKLRRGLYIVRLDVNGIPSKTIRMIKGIK